MTRTWLVSDTHFDHARIIEYANRPFENVEVMNETMVSRWNQVVGENDRVYHLGDVTLRRRGLIWLTRLNGRKVLIKGNHDIFPLKDYALYFEDVRAYKVLGGDILCSHVPVHVSQFKRFRANIHGHTHQYCLGWPYVNISVEHTDYAPVNVDVILQTIAKKQGVVGRSLEVPYE